MNSVAINPMTSRTAAKLGGRAKTLFEMNTYAYYKADGPITISCDLTKGKSFSASLSRLIQARDSAVELLDQIVISDADSQKFNFDVLLNDRIIQVCDTEATAEVSLVGQAEAAPPQLFGPDGSPLEISYVQTGTFQTLDATRELVRIEAFPYLEPDTNKADSISVRERLERFVRSLVRRFNKQIFLLLRRLQSGRETFDYVTNQRSWHILHGGHPPRFMALSQETMNLLGVPA